MHVQRDAASGTGDAHAASSSTVESRPPLYAMAMRASAGSLRRADRIEDDAVGAEFGWRNHVRDARRTARDVNTPVMRRVWFP
jgi:hypothetical protein